MFDIGWPEMLVIAVVLIVVVGPKDLPKMLRTFGKTTSNMRRMAGDFRKQFDEAMKEAELDDIKSTIDSARKLNPAADIKKALNPMEKAAADVRAGLDDLMKPKAVAEPAPSTATAAEPAKAGPTAMPGEATAAAQAETTAPAKPAPEPAAVNPAPAKASGAAQPAAAKAASPAKPAAASKPAAAAKKPVAETVAAKPAAKPKAVKSRTGTAS